MHVLILYVHPEPTSFTAAFRDAAVAEIQRCGGTVEVSDLYAEGFEAVAGRHDFLEAADSSRFHYQAEQLHASRNGTFAPDIAREQSRVAAADAIIAVFPLWWGGVPAILKGWFDRVLAYGFAYEDGMRYETGFFRGRRGLLGVTTGGIQRRFTGEGSYGTIDQVLWPTQHCMLEYLGLETHRPFVAYASPRVTPEVRAEYLNQWRERVRELMHRVDGTVPHRVGAATEDRIPSAAWAAQR